MRRRKYWPAGIAAVAAIAGCGGVDNRELTNVDGGTKADASIAGSTTGAGGRSGTGATGVTSGSGGYATATTGGPTTGGPATTGGPGAGGSVVTTGATTGVTMGAGGTVGAGGSTTGAGGSMGGSGGSAGGSKVDAGTPDAGPTCGNGRPDPGEQCDDGNSTNGDGCENNCKYTCSVDGDCALPDPCAGTRTCNQGTHVCTTPVPKGDNTPCGQNQFCKMGKCTAASCGNHTVDPNEECDDGNMTNGDGCENSCKFTCVAGDPVRGCTPANPCQTSTCNSSTHVCSQVMTVSDNTSCGTSKYCKAGVCTQIVCGNGIKEPGETCDDGHTTSCGPCNATCSGAGTGSVCGDNQVCPDTEACDDGDDIVCGSCNASCTGAGQTSNCCVTPSATNKVVNAGFNSSDLSTWKAFDPQIQLSYSSFDSTACGSSGSMLETNAAPNGLNSGALQCVTVTAGATYNVGGRIRIPSGGARGQAFLNFVFADMPNCFGNLIGSNLLDADYMLFDTWQYVHKENVVAPAGAVSMQVYAQTVKNFPDAKSFQAYYDMLYVTPVPGKF